MILAKVAEKKGCNAEGPTLLVIDYELGDARVYIEENFDIVETNAQWSTHLARFRRCQNVAAVIFDPAIDHEKGPICRADPNLCQGDNRRRIKSKDACRQLGEVLNNHLQPLVAWIAQNIPKLYTW
ncbi:hypothetical protein [Pyrobaculum neutrophilum]|uniref:Uncharacterized protein n=1 Tax=Pyrobaculum neutrophilum (strain DSM 2338 / JCM 9278 / NBRC 100436 / V24Sta) TaxID=444157 RepID=B1YE25_PYRNV|nr:hypothetical protein [Pyrobaculum neutrophilum]ACB40038.1 hypothetical protein Tneu_1107 [Pyrobaculum neutrophilum V24Sta]